MTLPASFPISWQQICDEFGLAYTSSWPSAFYGKGGAPASGNLSFSDFLGRSNGPQYPTHVGTSALYASAASQNVVWPSHTTMDIGILLVATNNQALTTPTGCTPIFTPTGIGTAAGITGIRLHAYWIRATSASMANIATGDSGNFQVARLLVFRGCREWGSPIGEKTQGYNNTTTSYHNSPGWIMQPKSLILGFDAIAKDAADTDIMTLNSLGANLQNWSELIDSSDTVSNGGGLIGWMAELVAQGTVGPTRLTYDNTSMNREYVTFALLPKSVSGSPDYVRIDSSQTYNAPYTGQVKLHAFGGGGGSRNNISVVDSAGGGAYAGKNSQAISSGTGIVCTIGANTTGTSGTMGNGGDATIAIASVTQALAKGASGMTGGQASGSTGDVKYNGGNGASGEVWIDPEPPNTTNRFYGGAGGCAGSTSAGGNGTAGVADGGMGTDGADGNVGGGLRGYGSGGHAPGGITGGAPTIILEFIP